MTKYYTVYAGVNGAGKSTLYRMSKNPKEEKRVNSDEILRSFGGDWRNETDQFKAGKIAVERIREYIQQGISFNQETTLSTKYALCRAKEARELGFFTEMHYVGVESADISIERIKQRVKDGGHGIPDDLVRSRYNRSIVNLVDAIKCFDTVYIYDNTEYLKCVALYYKGVMVHSIAALPDWLKALYKVMI